MYVCVCVCVCVCMNGHLTTPLGGTEDGGEPPHSYSLSLTHTHTNSHTHEHTHIHTGYKVLFIDYGNKAVVKASEIR